MKALLILVFIAHAMPAFSKGQCIDVEVHPETREKMSESQWQRAHQEWVDEEPKNPGYLNLLLAYGVYSAEKRRLGKLRGDKRKHCYMGCRIARRISLNTAIYVAWYKEYEDLTDCNPKTFFEWRDYEFTVDGAEAGASMGNTGNCMKYCQNQPRK